MVKEWSGVMLLAMVLGACSNAGQTGPSFESEPAASTLGGDPSALGTQPASNPDPTVIEGLFDVGGHELYMRCSGTGSPTVVYLHGSIPDPAFSGSSSALEIQDLLDESYRMCVYDRTNVGRSDSIPGPLDGESSVADLHALLEAADIEPPYVLLPASFGGPIADIFAATYPGEVVGMVQLDANPPGTLEAIDNVFVPPEERLQPDHWMGTNEEIDEVAVFAQARALEASLPAIPLTYLAIPPDPTEDPDIATAYRALQQDFVDRFSPGQLIVVDVDHYMEPVIPERIADEVRRLIVAIEQE